MIWLWIRLSNNLKASNTARENWHGNCAIANKSYIIAQIAHCRAMIAESISIAESNISFLERLFKTDWFYIKKISKSHCVKEQNLHTKVLGEITVFYAVSSNDLYLDLLAFHQEIINFYP